MNSQKRFKVARQGIDERICCIWDSKLRELHTKMPIMDEGPLDIEFPEMRSSREFLFL